MEEPREHGDRPLLAWPVIRRRAQYLACPFDPYSPLFTASGQTPFAGGSSNRLHVELYRAFARDALQTELSLSYLQYKWPSDAIEELSALIRAPDSTCTMSLYPTRRIRTDDS